MKRIIKKTIAIVLVLSVLISLTFVANAETVNTVGNTPGNISNMGFVAAQGDWIYYNNFYEDKLYKISTDGLTKQAICSDECQYANVVGDWIYYVSGNDYFLYKIKTDGTSKTKLSNLQYTGFINVVGDYIYFIYDDDDGNGSIRKIKTDGTGETTILNRYVYSINVIDNVIYFLDDSDDGLSTNICSIATDGTNIKTLTTVSTSSAFILYNNYYNGYVYYTQYGFNEDGDLTNAGIMKVDVLTSINAKVADVTCRGLNVINDTIYYINDDNGYVYKMNLDGTVPTLFANVKASAICTNGDYVYIAGAEFGCLYSVKSDGTNLKLMYNIVAPMGLKAVSASYNSVKLTWDEVEDATGYAVYRYNGIDYVEIAKVTTPTYTNTGLTTGTSYPYKVAAYVELNGVKNFSGKTSYVSVRPMLPAPISLKAGSASYNSVKITWAATAGATGYNVYRYNGKSYVSIASVTGTAYTNAGLNTGTTYIYKTQAYRTVNGVKTYSGLSGYVTAKPILNVPGSFAAARVSASKIKVSWAAVAGASGYTVYKYNGSSYVALTNVTTLNYTNTGLTKNRTYYYKVAAYRLVNGAKVYSVQTAAKSAKTY